MVLSECEACMCMCRALTFVTAFSAAWLLNVIVYILSSILSLDCLNTRWCMRSTPEHTATSGVLAFNRLF